MESRSKNTKRNIIVGMIYRVIAIILPFLIRTAILKFLGEQYVGLSSLFTSILQVLNLAELGFSTAVIYNMYKPIAEGNTNEVCALLNYYKKVYRTIGIFIFCAGLLLMPWLPKLISGSWPQEINLYFLYFLYLINTSISYFLFAYKSALLNAVQRLDLVNIAQIVIHTSKYLAQLFVLVAFKNYYLYVVVAIIASAIVNLFTALISDKMYPQYQCRGDISDSLKKNVKTQVTGVMVSKLCDTSRNSFDSIVLSSLFGLTVVGIYNNYYYIYNALYAIMLVVTHAMQASVGNSVAIESVEKNYEDLNVFQFVYMAITGWMTICMLCIYQPFMLIWAGKDLMLSNLNMILFCVYFYVINLNNMRNLYFTGNGLWWKAKYTFLMEAFGNLLLNFGLGYLLGVTGIILATIVTIFGFNFVARTNILFKEYFKFSPKKFYLKTLRNTTITVSAAIIAYGICAKLIRIDFLGIVIRGIVCSVVYAIVFLGGSVQTKEMKPAITLTKKIIKLKNK